MSRKFTNTFTCCEKTLTGTEFKEHIQKEHGYIKGTPATRSLVMALDGSDFYTNTYSLEIPCGDKTIKVTQVLSGPRGKGDLLNLE